MCNREIMLRNICDVMCHDAVPMDDAIAERIKAFQQLISREQKMLLNRLLDDINNADSEAKYEAFEKGFLLGLLLVA